MGNVPPDVDLSRSLRKASQRMMETAPVLRFNPAQVAQLIGYCTEYRSSLWQYAMPTPERNQMIRSLQAFQGRREKAQEQAQVRGKPCSSRMKRNTRSSSFLPG